MFPLLLTLLAADTTGVGAALRFTVDTTSPAWMRWRSVTDVRPVLRGVYGGEGWRPLWVDVDGRPTPAARAMVRQLGQLRDRGLDPADYDAVALALRADSLDTPTRVAAYDVALSTATLRVARALDRGRVSPTVLHRTLRVAREPFAADSLLRAFAADTQAAARLRALEPPFYQYRRLLGVLERFRALARDTTLLGLPPMPKVLRPDSAYAGAGGLRRLLTALGDLPAAPALGVDTLYDATLQEGVRRFQRRQGLTDDAIIGAGTQARLRRPWRDRIRQVELTLERWRWLPRTHEVPPLIVNIPAFRLYGLRQLPDLEAETLTMDVVVGTAVTHDTPLLAAMLEAVNFQPHWNVPTSIATKEIKPKALANPGYLAKERYELLRGSRVVPITPEAIAEIGNGVRVRQMPGPGNALGRVKFVMPNREDIYLHDTPSRGLFARTRRDFSHGCIRVVDPAALARWALRDLPEWTPERIDSAMAGDRQVWVALPRKIPVYLVYQSVVVRESGEAFLYPDIYGHDATLDAALRKGYPFAGTALASAR